MEGAETDLQMAERHVRAGERNVADQQEMVSYLRSRGHPTEEAEQLLLTFIAILETHREHLSRLRAT